ncbi:MULTISPECIES: hypothetical protein [Paenibacillus]|uniref:Uncharacterized protein n=1 Tax=Paenibacillus macerans TaxID=44252 RepID=A0A6N8EQ07_PAEMA|nr:hypothetical protein [Paenibacillus macerans]MBS5910351.1 hypothetical protein [Paenibacillus macerans]MUG22396.1 hypothetical protein [Paenibacillus macerans]UMV49160.1 hypothetical protein LMZ02_07355 [Paenibacillus macerans]
MNLYDKKFQFAVTCIYPIAVFCLLSFGELLHSWTLPIVVTILFCLLWSKLSYLFAGTIVAWAVAVPIWWIIMKNTSESQSAAIFISSLPFIIISFIFAVLIPEMLFIIMKNRIVKYYANRRRP